MIDPIDSIISETFEYKIDMLHNMSLSSNASMIRYSLAYEGFNPRDTYPSDTSKSDYILTKKAWSYKVKGYKEQDEKAGRPTNDNVKEEDYEFFKELFKKEKCYLCGEPFRKDNKPTLDRINNKKDIQRIMWNHVASIVINVNQIRMKRRQEWILT